MRAKLSCIAILLIVGLGAGAVWAQDDAIKRTILQKAEVPGTPYVTVLGMAEIKAGARSAAIAIREPRAAMSSRAAASCSSRASRRGICSPAIHS